MKIVYDWSTMTSELTEKYADEVEAMRPSINDMITYMAATEPNRAQAVANGFLNGWALARALGPALTCADDNPNEPLVVEVINRFSDD